MWWAGRPKRVRLPTITPRDQRRRRGLPWSAALRGDEFKINNPAPVIKTEAGYLVEQVLTVKKNGQARRVFRRNAPNVARRTPPSNDTVAGSGTASIAASMLDVPA
jgi:hypothetical protein